MLVIAQTTTTDESSNFLVSPDVGLMIWTVIAFLVALFILRKYAWPAITDALDKRQRAIEESIDTAERARTEAAGLLEEYRERLKEARAQADGATSCWSRRAATSRPRPGARSRRSATRSPT